MVTEKNKPMTILNVLLLKRLVLNIIIDDNIVINNK